MKTVIFEFQPTPEQPPWLPAAGRREDAMRNTHIDLHDALDRALVAIGNDYPAGHLLDAHAHRARAARHRRHAGAERDGGWVVPPQRRLDPGRRHAPGADAGGQHAQLHRAGRGARGRTRRPAKWWRCRRCCASCCWRPWTCRRSTTGRARRRAGPTAAARGGPRAGAAAAHPAAARRGWGRARPSWRRRTSARGRRTGPGGCT